MRFEIHHINVSSAARTGALTGALVGVVGGLLIWVVGSAIVSLLFGDQPMPAELGGGEWVGIVTIFSFIIGSSIVVGLSAAALAVIYNLISSYIGGLEVDITECKKQRPVREVFFDDE